MGNVIHIDDRKRIQEDAAAWLSRIDRGLTDTERAGLDSWLQSDQRHIAAFLELAKAWDKLEDLGALSGLVELPPPKTREAAKSMRFGVAVALIGVAIFGLSVLIRESASDTTQNELISASSVTSRQVKPDRTGASLVFQTGVGEQRRISLVDGTVVSMNTRSTLRVSFDKALRRVDLQDGEATFEVAHDTERPFIVEASGKTIRAVGTIFTVRAKSKSNVSVIVTEGRVAVSAATSASKAETGNVSPSIRSTRLLEAGDRLELVGNRMQLERLSIDAIDDALAWQTGTIVFQGDPLVDALGEVSRYSDARFELTDETIGEMKIAGVFQIRDLNGFVDSLRANLGIGTRRLSDGTLSLYLIPTEARDTSSD